MSAQRREQVRSLDTIDSTGSIGERAFQVFDRRVVLTQARVHIGEVVRRHVLNARHLFQLQQLLSRLVRSAGQPVCLAELPQVQ